MFSRNAPDPLRLSLAQVAGFRSGPWSLAVRLTVWYVVGSFALVLGVTGLIYLALAANLDKEDDQELTTKIELLRTLLREHPDDQAALREVLDLESNVVHPQHHRSCVYILGPSAKTILESPDAEELLPSRAFPVPIPANEEPTSGTNMKSPTGKPLRVLSAQVQVGYPSHGVYTIQVALDRSSEDALLAEYRKGTWLVLGFALVIAAAGGYAIARHGIHPIEAITRAAMRIRTSTLSERLSTTGLPSEIGQLAGQFNEMLDRLEESFDRLSRFSNDIAHELRTPVGNLRGSVEVALNKQRTPDEYREVLGSCLEETSRLARIIDSLLLLARTENPATRIMSEIVDVRNELMAIREFYTAVANDAGMILDVDAPLELRCTLDRTLFQRAVINLVENALAHSFPGGTITIAAKEMEESVRVSVSDTGSGIPAEDLAHVFDRFYKSQDSCRLSTDSKGLGLGLPIVKGIAGVHGGSVEISSDIGCGTSVTLLIPTRSIVGRTDQSGHVEDR